MNPTDPAALPRIEAAMDLLSSYGTMAVGGCDAGDPWMSKVFYIEDEPAAGSFDLCCALLLSQRRAESLRSHARVAFVIAGEEPDRWIQGVGRIEVVADRAEREAIMQRLCDKAKAAESFLQRVDASAVRVHVERLKMTDLASDPPIAEFTFA